MNLIALVAMWILGFLSGAASIVALTIFIGKRALKRAEDRLKTNTKKIESVDSRIKKVKLIAAEQLDLHGSASGPQKNAMHGKHKNTLFHRIKELEEEKNAILLSIIADGFDPEVTVMDSTGIVTTIKLSQFLGDMGIVASSTKKPAPKDKFVVYRGGKDDDSGNNTTH